MKKISIKLSVAMHGHPRLYVYKVFNKTNETNLRILVKIMSQKENKYRLNTLNIWNHNNQYLTINIFDKIKKIKYEISFLLFLLLREWLYCFFTIYITNMNTSNNIKQCFYTLYNSRLNVELWIKSIKYLKHSKKSWTKLIFKTYFS